MGAVDTPTPHSDGLATGQQQQPHLSPSPRQRRKGLPALLHARRSPSPSPVSIRAPRTTRLRYDSRTRGRWSMRWRVLVVLLVALGVAALGALLLGRGNKKPLRIPKRAYELQPYRHLSFTSPISLAPSTRIFHVTKEFGPATMGGLGVMLTALAIAQAESPFLSVSVVLPFYSFLRTDSSPSYNISHFAEIRVPIAGNRGKTPKLVGCVVSLLRWEYESATDFLNPPSLSRNGNGDRTETTRRSIDIYLIGPGDQKPFNIAFKAKDAGDVYSAYKPLKQEWKDLWFAKASAELLTFLGYDGSRPYQNPIDTEAADDDEEGWELELQDANGDDDATVFVTSRTAGVDVVHLHGATNAMVGYFLRETERVERYDRTTTPAIVYTLHDSLDEVEYSNLVSNSLAFLDSPLLAPRFLEEMSDYIIEDRQLFASAVGIDVADAVTFVSRAIAQDIVEGRFRFALRDLVMPSIARKAKDGRFVGITNGLDFTDQAKNPFTSPVLVERGLAFPRVGTNVTDSSTFPSSPSPYSTTASSFAHTKLLAKQHLVSHLPSHFNFGPLDATRPYLLFIGRYQYNKGCQFFEPILRHLSSSSPLSSSGRLILLGARNNYPHSLLLRLASLYPNHLTLIDTIEDQREWGTIIRMASDFALVPSFSEAFGLVAAEGMLFGMSVVSSAVGGLAEFLVPIEREVEGGGGEGNAYTFELFGAGGEGGEGGEDGDWGVSAENSRVGVEELGEAVKGCVAAVERALSGWKGRMEGGEEARERFVRSRVADALRLKWSREKGPIEEYVRVYDLALTSRRGPSLIPLPHPISLSLPPLLSHPVAAPSIAHGGHDRVTGKEGVEALAQVAANVKPILPVFKVWLSTDDANARRKAKKLSVERKAMARQRKERERDEKKARKGRSRFGRLVGM